MKGQGVDAGEKQRPGSGGSWGSCSVGPDSKGQGQLCTGRGLNWVAKAGGPLPALRSRRQGIFGE